MSKLFKKPVFLLVIALLLGAWTVPPTSQAAVAQPSSASCAQGANKLVGRSASLPGVKTRIQELCQFSVNMSKISSLSQFDRDFISDSITSNTLELDSLQYAVTRVTNAEWKGQIEMMIAMHSYDLGMAIAVAKKVGMSTNPDLTSASVYPETPDYDLGKRTENLVDEYLNPLKNTTGVDFNTLSLDIISDEHVPDVQSEITAERLTKNSEIKAFSKHSADVSELHILLMSDLMHRLEDKYTPPPPDFQAPYQSPRQFQP